MKRSRYSIAMLMGVVLIVAMNLTIARSIYGLVPWRLAGIFLIGIVLQVGLFCLICSRGRPRPYAFWTGVEFGALLGMTTFLYARVPDSWVGSFWDSYATFIDRILLTHFGFGVLNRGPEDPILLLTVAVFGFLPQFLMALVGGFLGLSIGWSPRSRRHVFEVLEIVGILVANGALWATAWSVLPAQPPWLPVGVTPGGLLLQLGLYGLIRTWRRPQPRAFWVGFVAVGSLIYGSYLSSTVFTNVQIALALSYGPSDPSHAGPLPAVLLWKLWNDYVTLASHSLGRPAHGTFLVVWSGKPIDSLIYALIVLLPHLVAALGGGIVARLVASRAPDARRGDAPQPAGTG
jgi:hypothetical protein